MWYLTKSTCGPLGGIQGPPKVRKPLFWKCLYIKCSLCGHKTHMCEQQQFSHAHTGCVAKAAMWFQIVFIRILTGSCLLCHQTEKMFSHLSPSNLSSSQTSPLNTRARMFHVRFKLWKQWWPVKIWWPGSKSKMKKNKKNKTKINVNIL